MSAVVAILLIYGGAITVAVVAVGWRTYRLYHSKPAVNVVGGVEFPSPDDSRWRRIGRKHYHMNSKIFVDGSLWGSVEADDKHYRGGAGRYARAVDRAQRGNADRAADCYVARVVEEVRS